MTAAETLALLDWKRRVFALYAAIRSLEPESGWQLWRHFALRFGTPFGFGARGPGIDVNHGHKRVNFGWAH